MATTRRESRPLARAILGISTGHCDASSKPRWLHIPSAALFSHGLGEAQCAQPPTNHGTEERRASPVLRRHRRKTAKRYSNLHANVTWRALSPSARATRTCQNMPHVQNQESHVLTVDWTRGTIQT